MPRKPKAKPKRPIPPVKKISLSGDTPPVSAEAAAAVKKAHGEAKTAPEVPEAQPAPPAAPLDVIQDEDLGPGVERGAKVIHTRLYRGTPTWEDEAPARRNFARNLAAEVIEASKDVKRGRPTDFDPDVAQMVLDRIAGGEPLFRIAQDGGPPVTRVLGWVKDGREGFSEAYGRAREQGWHVIAEQIIEIADTSKGDYIVRSVVDDSEVKGVYVQVDHDNINRARLRLDARKFMLSKMLPKIYGDKLDLTVTGNPTADLSDDKLNMMIEAYIRQIGMPPELLAQVMPYLTVTVLPGEFRALPAPGSA